MIFNPELIRAISNKNPIRLFSSEEYSILEPYAVGVGSDGLQRLIGLLKNEKMQTSEITAINELDLPQFEVLDEERFEELQTGYELFLNQLFVVLNRVR